jgi:CRP-like cAMP-binding protein
VSAMGARAGFPRRASSDCQLVGTTTYGQAVTRSVTVMHGNDSHPSPLTVLLSSDLRNPGGVLTLSACDAHGEPMSHGEGSNEILSSLSPGLQQKLSDRLLLQELRLNDTLFLSGDLTHTVHFPISGTVSMLSLTGEGEAIEAALLGSESVVGYWLALGLPRSPVDALVQSEGEALVMAGDEFLGLLQGEPEFRAAVLRSCGGAFAVVTQTVACTQFHQVQSRTARWLLGMHDRHPGDEFRTTQHSMSLMLGVHRPEVIVALRALAEAGIIKHAARSQLRVVDRAALEDASCECYERTRMVPASSKA